MKNKNKNNNITERIGIVVIIILILLLSFRRKLFFKNEDNITIVEPDKNLLELTASESTDGLNGNSTQIISLTQQITNLTEYINYLTNQINESNGDNSVLEAEVAALQGQLNTLNNDLTTCENYLKVDLEVLRKTMYSNGNQSMGAIYVEVKGGVAPFTYEWQKDDIVVSTANYLTAHQGKGFYRLMVTDSLGNYAGKKVEIPGRTITPVVSISLIGNVATVNVTAGAIGAVRAIWSTGETALSINMVPNSSARVEVFDSEGLIYRSGVNYYASATYLSTSWIDNIDLTSGVEYLPTVAININGPENGFTNLYSFAWSDGYIGQLRSNFAAGTYEVTATAAGHATIITSLSFVSYTTTINTSLQPATSGNENGVITINSVTGRIGANLNTVVQYITGGTTVNKIIKGIGGVYSGLKAGNYKITIQDENSKTVTKTVTV